MFGDDTLVLEGVQEVMAALKKKTREYPEAAGFALYRAGIRIYGPAVKKAPREFGMLRASAYISAPYVDGQDKTVEVGFGTTYAIEQHENEYYNHKDGQSHFLESAVSENIGTMLQKMGRDIDHAVKTGDKYGQIGGVPTRPTIGPGTESNFAKNSKSRASAASRKNGRGRFKKQLANVKARTGR